MNKSFFVIIFGTQLAVAALAQEPSPLLKPVNELPTLGNESSREPAVHKNGEGKAAKAKESKGPTEIFSKEVNFDAKTRVGVFSGNVKLNDPQFNLAADKLTVVMKKEPTPAEKAKAAQNPSVEPSKGKADKDSSSLEKAIAEGHVVITQDKPSEDGGEPIHYVGKANRVDYDSKTGDVILTGWPQIQQGINLQAATEEGTVMVLNRDGRLKTTGHSHTVFQAQGDSKSNEATPK